MRKVLLLSSFICFTFLSPALGQTDYSINSDTLKASKIAQKAQKLYASGKAKKMAQAIELYKEAGSMGLPSACRFLADYYMGTTPPDVDNSIHWTEILGDLGDSTSVRKLVSIYSGSLGSKGYPSQANIPKLFEWSKVLASSGDISGMETCAACCLLSNDTTQAISWFEKAAEAGSLTSQRSLARIYSGPGVNNVPDRAFKYAVQAADQGDKECLHMAGIMYMNGYGCQQDFSKAYSYLEKCKGEPLADLDMNLAYCRVQMNDGVIDSTTFDLLLSAADKGDSAAEQIVADCYANGNGVDKDLSKALEWYLKAAEHDNPYAQYTSGVLLLSGEPPIVQDQTKGIELLKKAAASGLPAAQFDLGMLYINGTVVEKDAAKGIELLESSSAGGNPIAQMSLGTIYYQGELVTKDDKKALLHMQSAAIQGNAEAQFNTGFFYQNNIGTRNLKTEERLSTDELIEQNKVSGNAITNEQIAIYWMRKASEAGHAAAQANMAMLILNGSAAGSESEAVALLNKASDNGLVDAQYTLGTLYFNGKAGLPKDVQKGVSLVKKAADQGHVMAQMELGMLYLNGDSGIAQDKAAGFKYLKKAADQGLPAAMYYVALCYNNGIGVRANLAETKKWLNKAANQNLDPQVQATAKEALKNLM